MSENSLKSIRNGAIASVLGGIVLLAIPALRGYFFSFIAWLWAGVVWCWNALFVSYSLPGWAWLMIFVLAFIGFISLYLAIKGDSRQPEFKAYSEDCIHGAKWRWNWA